MDHNKAGGVDLHIVTGTHDKRAAGHGHAIHDTGQRSSLGRQITEPVMDQDRHSGIAADAVHTDGQCLGPGQVFQVAQKFILHDEVTLQWLAGPPVLRMPFHDLAVHGDFRILPVRHLHDIRAAVNADCCGLAIAVENNFQRARHCLHLLLRYRLFRWGQPPYGCPRRQRKPVSRSPLPPAPRFHPNHRRPSRG